VIGQTVELEGLTRDGTVFPLELSISSWNTVEGPAFIGIIRDLSIRKEADEAIRKAREEAEQARDQAEDAQRAAEEADRAKSEFLSRMSHELRTPLNAVVGFGQLLEMEDLDPDSKESVGQIIRAGRHLLDLINEVLDISRIEAGSLSLSLEAVPLIDLATEAAEMVRPMAAERKITIETDPGELRSRYVLADRQRLKQVILNLLSNAVKYNREGGRVVMSLRSTDEGDVRLEVADSGHGIEEADVGRLFLPFQRLGAEHTGVEGTGLGLALSKGLVDAMGGSIGASSVPGEGTTFWVDLREAETPSAFVGLDDDPIPASSADGERTVLYVEDNVPNLRLVEQVAARRPHIRLLSAMQGQLGIDLARQHRPDLILLDLHLPDMSGEEVLRTLREDPATSAIPVVMISADATSSTAKRLLEAGARSYLTKPLDMRRFVRLVEGE
jgi:signal transduction histidine kinase/CheY-like chemotaxis protein